MSLLPDPSCLTLEAIRPEGDGVVIAARTRTKTARCPLCGRASERVHSRYLRTLIDLPWAGMPVRFHLRVRKFRCDNHECSRQIFSERIPSVAASHAQKTARLSEALLQLTWLSGGEAAARIARLLGLSLSPDSLLYCLKAAARDRPLITVPRVLGVDDFAFRRGHIPVAAAAFTEPFWSPWRSSAPSTCCRTAKQRLWKTGSGLTPVWRSCAVTAVLPTPRPLPKPFLKPSR